MRSKLFRLSLAQLIAAAITFIINYFFYHFVTDSGITTVWQAEAGKPFVSLLIGILATLFLFGAATSALMAFILFDKNKRED